MAKKGMAKTAMERQMLYGYMKTGTALHGTGKPIASIAFPDM